jgi:hypothetical protein
MRGHDDPTAIGHRIAGVLTKIEQHLTELRWIADDLPLVG